MNNSNKIFKLNNIVTKYCVCCNSSAVGHQQQLKISIEDYLTPANILQNHIVRQKCLDNMNNAPQIRLAKKSTGKFASVLIPMCEQNNELSILFTQRSGKLSKHVRQISFPGGIKDETDKSFVECALRETNEEIGLKSNRIEIWGTGKLVIPKDGPEIMPVIGVVRNFNENELYINKDEVDEVFTVPLNFLCSDKCKKHTQFRTGNGYSIPVFYINSTKQIWGITAVITYLFLSSLLPKTIYKHNIKYISSYPIKENVIK